MPRAAKALIRAFARNVAALPRSSGARDEVKADADDGNRPRLRRPRGAFNEDAARLRRTDKNVVRPFETQAGNVSRAPDGIDDGDAGNERKLPGLGRRAVERR